MSLRKGLILLVLILFVSFDTPKLVRVKVNNSITLMLPKDFSPMDDIDFVQRFPSVRQPLAAYTDPNREIGVSVNISATQWPDGNVEMAKGFFKSSIYNTFDAVDMISEGIREHGHKKLIWFEFESRIKGNPRELGSQDPVLNYSYLVYLVEPEQTLVFSFNCPRRLRPDWQETAHKIMTSIRIK